jgi:hypothetical protein
MLVLIDESLPRALGRALTGYDAQTVRPMRWNGLSNGALLSAAAAAGFDALVTADRNLEYQQDLRRVRLGIVVLRAPSNRVADMLTLAPSVLKALAVIVPGQVIRIGEQGPRRGRRRRGRFATPDHAADPRAEVGTSFEPIPVGQPRRQMLRARTQEALATQSPD